MANVTIDKKIVPFLWYDNQAEEAMKLYTSLFPNSKILTNKKWGEGSNYPPDSVMVGTIELDGLLIHMFDAGPHFKFNESFSLLVYCETQEEIDKYWNALTADGGQESQCGWLKDKFGLSWQITPTTLMEKWTKGGDPVKSAKMFQAMMKMKKLNIAELEAAYNS